MSGRRGRGKRGGRKSRRDDGAVARLQVALLVTVLLAAGVLIGSFLIEWRHTRLETPDPESTFAGTPRGFEEDSVPVRVRVEVLNGAGAPGAAKDVAERLRRMGFDVVYAGNAGSFDVTRSHLIDRSGRLGVARTVADSAGIDSLATGLNPELHLDATIVLGTDWQSLFTRPEIEPESEPGFFGRLLKRLRD